MLNEAIHFYHSLLEEPGIAPETQQQLSAEVRVRGLLFGERPLATVLRPRLLTAGQYAQLQHACHLVGTAARRVVAAALEPGHAGDEVRTILALTSQEQTLLAMHPGYGEPCAHSRMDTFMTVDGTSLQFVEYNAESPAAIAYSDVMSELFLDLPVMRLFTQRYPVQALTARPHMLATLLKAWEAAGAPGGTPQIAIVDWAGIPTATEFELFRTYFIEQGLTALICTPHDLAWRDGKLYAHPADGSAEVPITLVYKRVLTSELLAHYGDAFFTHPLVQAYAANACVLVNSFHAKLLHKKSLFALLTDVHFQDWFTPEERAALAQHLPWTRLVQPGETTYQGTRIDLLAFVRANRERLVLKPNDEYGGKGITIGWECTSNAWDAALAAALAAPFVVQERVTIAYEPYPALVDGRVVISDRLVDSDPFLFDTTVAGCLCRLSTMTLLNVTAGGGSAVPVFVLPDA